MFFGPFNALTGFQSYVNKILKQKPNVFVIVYLNNILIYIKNAGQGPVEVV